MLFSKNCAVEICIRILYDKYIEKLFLNRENEYGNEMEDMRK